MSSESSPTTGTRENPDRTKSADACRSDLPRAMVSMSIRGTMTSRAVVSDSSKTEWIMSRSSSSMSWFSSARSTRSRSSASVSKGPLRSPDPGVTALATRTRPVATGPSTVRSPTVKGAASGARTS